MTHELRKSNNKNRYRQVKVRNGGFSQRNVATAIFFKKNQDRKGIGKVRKARVECGNPACSFVCHHEEKGDIEISKTEIGIMG